MKKLERSVPELTREHLVNPHGTYAERLTAVGATSFLLRFAVEELALGYSRITPSMQSGCPNGVGS